MIRGLFGNERETQHRAKDRIPLTKPTPTCRIMRAIAQLDTCLEAHLPYLQPTQRMGLAFAKGNHSRRKTGCRMS